MSYSRSIESTARDMLWQIFSPMDEDKPGEVSLFEWFPRVYYNAELKPPVNGYVKLIVSKKDFNKPRGEQLVWEESKEMHFGCTSTAIPTIETFNQDVFYLVRNIRGMIANHNCLKE